MPKLNLLLRAEELGLSLTSEQLSRPSISYYTLDAIAAEVANDVPQDVAYSKYVGLTIAQIAGVQRLGLNDEQVKVEHFGLETVDAIEAAVADGVPLDEAYSRYVGLTNPQILGIIRFGFTRDQVEVKHFGYETVDAIAAAVANGASPEEVYSKYAGLTTPQVIGIEKLGLTRSQVQVENFGYETVDAIKAAVANGASPEEVYSKYAGLTIPQVIGIEKLGLTRAQVLVPNFGLKTVDAIKAAVANGVPPEEAYEKYKGLTFFQIVLASTDEQTSINDFNGEPYEVENSGGSTLYDYARDRMVELTRSTVKALVLGKIQVVIVGGEEPRLGECSGSGSAIEGTFTVTPE